MRENPGRKLRERFQGILQSPPAPGELWRSDIAHPEGGREVTAVCPRLSLFIEVPYYRNIPQNVLALLVHFHPGAEALGRGWRKEFQHGGCSLGKPGIAPLGWDRAGNAPGSAWGRKESRHPTVLGSMGEEKEKLKARGRKYNKIK